MAFVIYVPRSGQIQLSVDLGDNSLSSLPPGQALCLGDATQGGEFYSEGDSLSEVEATHLARFATGAFNVLVAGEAGSEYRVLQDRLGLRPLYLYEKGGACAVSDSLWALVQHLKAEGLAPTLNREAFDLQLASDKFVAEHPFTMDTLVDGVRVSIPGSTITVGAKGLTETPRVGPGRLGVSDADYQALLAQAASEIADNVRAPIDSHRFTHYYSDITGGRDSRAVLAALRYADRIGEVRFRHRPCGMVEGMLAQSLIAICGGEFLTKAPGSTQPESAEAYLDEQFQRYFGVNHALSSRFAMRTDPQAPSVLFRGGLGEVYRNHYAKPVAREGEGLEFPFAGMLNKRHLLPKARAEAAVQRLEAGLRALPGDTAEEQYYWHYRYLRNRFHFGLANVHSGFHVVNPLYSHAALDLAEQVPMEMLSSGRLMADLTAALDAELAALPYASDFAAGKVPTQSFERMPLVTYNPAMKTWYSGMGPRRNQVTVDESVYAQAVQYARRYLDEIEPEGEQGVDKQRYLKGLQQNIDKRKLKFVARDWFKFRSAALLLNG